MGECCSKSHTNGQNELSTQRIVKGQLKNDENEEEQKQISLLTRVGGKDAVSRIVKTFHAKALQDKKVGHFFKGVDDTSLKLKLTNFLAEQFGGPKIYKGKDMLEAHEKLKISNSDFDHLASLFLQSVYIQNMTKLEVQQIQQIWEQQRILVVTQQMEKKTPEPVETNIYDKIGGLKTVHESVERFYSRVKLDRHLKHHFEAADEKLLKQHLKDFLTSVLGGPNKYSGKDMKTAHRQLRLRTIDFERFVIALIESFQRQRVKQNYITVIEGMLRPLKYEIVTYLNEPLYAKLGEIEGIEIFVYKFYENIKEDDKISRFFKHTDMKHQQQSMINYLSWRFGGDIKYSGPSLRVAHEKILIQEDHFDRFAQVAAKTLLELKASQEIINQVLLLFAEFKYDISMRKIPILDQLGGKKQVEELVKQFFNNIQQDKEIGQYFDRINISIHKKNFNHFMMYLLSDKKKTYNGKNIRTVHQALKISQSEFNIFKYNMIQLLKKIDAEQHILDDVNQSLEELRDDIVYDPRIVVRLGGAGQLKIIVEEFFANIIQDHSKLYDKYFKAVNFDNVRIHLFKFLQMAFGGKQDYKGKDMKTAHQSLRINDIYFEEFTHLFEDIVRKYTDDTELIKEITNFLESYREILVDPHSRKAQSKAIQDRTLLTKLGGVPGLNIILDEFCLKIQTNSVLSPYVQKLQDHAQKNIIKVYFIQIFGGDKNYYGRDMKVAHKGLAITETIFNEFVKVLFNIIEQQGIHDKEVFQEITECFVKQKIEIINTIDDKIPLINQIGGKQKIEQIIDKTIDLCCKDPQLEKIFKVTEDVIKKIKLHLVQFLVENLGGPDKYNGKNIEEAHKSLKISKSQFDAFCMNLIKAMKQFQLHTGLIRSIGKIIDGKRSVIQVSK